MSAAAVVGGEKGPKMKRRLTAMVSRYSFLQIPNSRNTGYR